MKAVTTILFDLDGTLIDTTDLIVYCFDHCWQAICGRTHPREALVATMGIPLPMAMRRLLNLTEDLNAARLGETRTAELAEQLVIEYRSCNAENHDRLARSFEGMAEVVAELRRRQYSIGLVTSKSRVFALRGLKLCGLSELMDEAIFMEDTERHKPNPEPLLLGLERLKVLAEHAAYVGDSCHDMQAGRAARVRTVAALWGPVPAEELKKEQPDFLVPAASNLLEIFQ